MTILRFIGWLIALVVIVGAAGSVWFVMNKPAAPLPVIVAPAPTSTPPRVVAEASYLCDEGHTIQATFMDSGTPMKPATPDTPPMPNGSVSLTLDSAAPVVLDQLISADGARYGNAGDVLVFWSKGTGAIVLESGVVGTYTNCIVEKDAAGGVSKGYHDGKAGFTLRYPADFTVTASYTYNGLGAKKGIMGTKFTIPTSTATGTNLATGTYLSVEHLSTTTESCDAGNFLLAGTHATATTITKGDMTYSFASSTDAAAGNRYEENVYAIPGSSPCLAVRTFIHYGVLENYASGTVKGFDRAALTTTFDTILASLTYMPHLGQAQ